MTRSCFIGLAAIAVAMSAGAQDHASMDHAAMHAVAGPLPTMPGQDAFGAISEVVRLLQADSTTDWSKVNIEAMRMHLIDMNAVVLGSAVHSVRVPAGLQMTVTGDARTAPAIRRMTTAHGAALSILGVSAVSKPITGGALFTVTAVDTTDGALIAQLRGLGFAGIMTLGNHHAAHHLAIAKGEAMPMRPVRQAVR